MRMKKIITCYLRIRKRSGPPQKLVEVEAVRSELCAAVCDRIAERQQGECGSGVSARAAYSRGRCGGRPKESRLGAAEISIWSTWAAVRRCCLTWWLTCARRVSQRSASSTALSISPYTPCSRRMRACSRSGCLCCVFARGIAARKKNNAQSRRAKKTPALKLIATRPARSARG